MPKLELTTAAALLDDLKTALKARMKQRLIPKYLRDILIAWVQEEITDLLRRAQKGAA